MRHRSHALAFSSRPERFNLHHAGCPWNVTKVKLPTLYFRNLDKLRRGLTLESGPPRRVSTLVIRRGERFFENSGVGYRCQSRAGRIASWVACVFGVGVRNGESAETGRIFSRKSFEWNILTSNSFRWNILRGKVFPVPLLSIFCEGMGGGGYHSGREGKERLPAQPHLNTIRRTLPQVRWVTHDQACSLLYSFYRCENVTAAGCTTGKRA